MQKQYFGFDKSVYETIPHCPNEGIGLIIGGTEARPAEFPHAAAIGWYQDGGIEFNCGGSLISEKYILTAAHCLASHSKYEVKSLNYKDLLIFHFPYILKARRRPIGRLKSKPQCS